MNTTPDQIITSTINGDHIVTQKIADYGTGTIHEVTLRYRSQILECHGQILAAYGHGRAPRMWWVDPHGIQDATAVQCGTCGSTQTADYTIDTGSSMTVDWLKIVHDHEDATGATAEQLALWVNVIIRIQSVTGLRDETIATIVQDVIDAEAA